LTLSIHAGGIPDTALRKPPPATARLGCLRREQQRVLNYIGLRSVS
jgi:hypothetical protein